MPHPEQLAIQQEHMMREIKDVIAELDPEAAARLDRFNGLPVSGTRPDEHALFVLEALAVLLRKAQPRKRGRPRRGQAGQSGR